MNAKISIDNLIEIVRTGGKIKTGVDVYNSKGILLLDKDILVEKVKILEILKDNGIKSVPVNTVFNGGLWDGNGNLMNVNSDGLIDFEDPDKQIILEPVIESPETDSIFPDVATNEIEMRLLEIEEIKKQATKKYYDAKNSIKKVLADIKNTGGQFDYVEVEANVSDLVDFLVIADNPFSYLTQEIFSYDDYLYNHSINVCAIGTAVVNRFNTHFSGVVDGLLKGHTPDIYNPFEKEGKNQNPSYVTYYKDELSDISLGFFLHDIGKIIVSDEILNKQGRLTALEFEEVKKHSYEYGVDLLDKNHLKNSVIRNIINYHHAPLYEGEERCYPTQAHHTRIPLYARICKLADIYDAMTSKRCYKEAINPINVVTQLFRTYAKKDRMLQYILHAFVKSIGIYPPGSIIYLRNGQMAYVLESDGPLVIPFTDDKEKTLKYKPDPININTSGIEESRKVDSRRSVKAPKDVYDMLPPYIKEITARS
ncbi:MAG: HD domain-containing protein [Proteobacteria bacterium]|nr:HD domain-containing protein [Pseudomonadota bacterium]MBU1585721.1 HD domain-containing protein [Pseudomonadota bacterium]MBU2452516.1 HD domain-containing protein [Pseudomonadota bacterium]